MRAAFTRCAEAPAGAADRIAPAALVKYVPDQKGMGAGLEAIKRIPAGTIISEYSSRRVHQRSLYLRAQDVATAVTTYKFMHGSAIADYVYLGDPTDRLSGSMINDATPTAFIDALKTSETVVDVALWVNAYQEQCIRFFNRSNVTADEALGVGGGLQIVAIQQIEIGEPLLMFYGADYWLETLSADPEVPLRARLAIFALLMVRIQLGCASATKPLLLIASKLQAVPIPLKPKTCATADCKVFALESIEMKQETADTLSDQWIALMNVPTKESGYKVWATALHQTGLAEYSRAPLCGEPGLNECAKCAQPARSRCAACHGVKYCSKPCQQSDWGEHRPFCQRVKATRLALAAAAGDKK